MAKKKHLFIGFGDIAARCAKVLIAQGDEVVGVARTPRNDEAGLSFITGDAKSAEVLACIAEQSFESAVITLSPSAYSEADYRECYYDTSKTLLSLWAGKANAPNKTLFISSTSVYSQNNGELIDEESAAEPSSPTAKVLRETESLFLESNLPTSVIRFSGIYGPGRDYLLRQVQKGNGGSAQYTNRIHVEDCCGVICFLIAQKTLHDVYLASDDCPVTSKEIREWLADKLGVDGSTLMASRTPGRGGSKRCSNQRLKSAGYTFKYPEYKKGYCHVISTFLGSSDSEGSSSSA
ncbi:MAG: NAD-dependent epimerase/dehydratase family protein [Agarilytica sp.]